MEVKKPNEISSEQHTLFVRTIPESKRPLDRKNNIYQIRPKYKIFTLYIERFKELKRGLHSVFNELRQAGTDDVLEIRINSGGGSVNEGLQFYNLMREKFDKRTHAYLDNHGYSMGALLFCMADRRVVYPYSDLMFHNYASTFSGKGGELKSRLEHRDRLLRKFFKDIIVKKGFLTESEFEEMIIGKDFWMGVEEMCERGIATHVVHKHEEIKAKKYLKIIKKKRKLKKDREA
jgi:ATP-dependent protease ClpP protease subunit